MVFKYPHLSFISWDHYFFNIFFRKKYFFRTDYFYFKAHLNYAAASLAIFSAFCTASSIVEIISGVVEAGIEGVPSVGFSLLDYDWDADFDGLERYVKNISNKILTNGLPDGVVLNVNFPKISDTPFKGIKIARQARANWNEKFDKRINPMGKNYYWLTGVFENLDGGEDTDEFALGNNYVSVVPVQFDLTAHHFIQTLNTWSL